MFNIAQANRDLGRPVEAIEAFEKFLAGAADASSETVADVRKSVAELQRKLGRIQIDCETAGAEIGLDGKYVGVVPLPDLIWATPGRHQVTAKHASAAPAIEDADVTAGSVSTVTLQLRPLAASLVASAPKAVPNSDVQATARPARRTRVGGWAEDGHGWRPARPCLLAVGAISAGLLMDSRFDSLRQLVRRRQPGTTRLHQSQLDTLNSRQTAANVLWGLTAAAAVTTERCSTSRAAVTVTPVAGGATGVLARMEF